jgi:hypothetical protein
MHGWIWMISREVDIFKNNNNPFVSNLKYCMLGKKQFSWITWEWLPPNPQHFCVYVLQTRTLFYINTYSNQSKELTSICCWSPKILCRSFCQLSQSYFFCFCFVCFWYGVSLCIPAWPRTCDLPAYASPILKLQVYTTIPAPVMTLVIKISQSDASLLGVNASFVSSVWTTFSVLPSWHKKFGRL